MVLRQAHLPERARRRPGASGAIPNGGLAAFLNTTQNLWAVGQALKQPFRTIGLDNWSGPHKAGVKPELVRQMLQAVRAQGWEQIAVNEVGGFYDSFGLAATAEFLNLQLWVQM